MVLGDNIFYGNGFSKILKAAVEDAEDNGRATVFGYHATNEGGYISWYDFCVEFYKQYGLKTKVISVTTVDYGFSKATRPSNSRLDKSKLTEARFIPLPDWKDAISRCLNEWRDKND